VSESLRAKNPKHVEAGRRAARARWGDGPQRWVKLDGLSDKRRRAIVAMVDEARAEQARAEARGTE
jgi:hypothetical protein